MFGRFDLYAPVHKGIRVALSGLCLQAGSVDITDDEGVRSFIEEFKRVVVILHAHSRDEDAHINESYEKYAPETLLQLEEEHTGLEQKLEKLNELVNQLESGRQHPARYEQIWYQIGKDINRFTAEYFMHLEHEEGPGMKALWEHLTDDQLKVISINIRSSIPPQAMLIFLHYMIPAISHQERVEMLSDMRSVAPQEFYEEVVRIAENRLEPQSLSELKSALNNNITGAVG